MLDFAAAKAIGMEACIEKMGKAFVKKHADTLTTAYACIDDGVFCFVGVNDQPEKPSGEGIILDGTPFPYRVSCRVNCETGAVSFVESVVPAEQEDSLTLTAIKTNDSGRNG